MSTIIVGVDGSHRGEDAIALASRIAAATGAELLLVNASPDSEEAEIILRAMRRLAEGGAVRTLAVPGYSPAKALHALAESERADLIVVGSTRLGRLGRVVPGSTAEQLLQGSPCPVAVAPHGFRRAADAPARVIGAAVDGSAESAIALEEAAAVAAALEAELRVIAVCDADEYGLPAAVGGPGFVLEREKLDRRAKATLAAAVEAVRADVRVTPALRFGEPGRVLVEESEALDALFMGSRGYGPLRAVVTGGVSGRVVRGAACAVIVTPRGAAVPVVRNDADPVIPVA